MTTNPADITSVPEDRARKLEEIIRAKRAAPIQSVEDWIVPGVFESDEEVDEFIAFTYAERHANLG